MQTWRGYVYSDRVSVRVNVGIRNEVRLVFTCLLFFPAIHL